MAIALEKRFKVDFVSTIEEYFVQPQQPTVCPNPSTSGDD